MPFARNTITIPMLVDRATIKFLKYWSSLLFILASNSLDIKYVSNLLRKWQFIEPNNHLLHF